ncbi:hypothetical protein BUALT_Bualt08G0131200 [Buddleja alternifolia]|uniref:ATP-dependent DNA helicase n=1 Tax=Buddleja alternifolia TaxID=168488 RepID=A0AAV6XED3_9LAMI|nr:hypothetical protein BUALT_Bualt08G0131200 [Buddleja alternifolia]
MNQESFTYLPSEIIINILSRLPIRTIITSKCICKSWLDLIETPEFAEFHLSKSVPGLIVYQSEIHSNLFKIYDFKEAVEEIEHHELRYNRITQFDRRSLISLPHAGIGIEGSANGLLFLREINTQPNALYICNPITRDYIQLPHPQRSVHYYPTVVTYGFGVSKLTDQYKVVRIFHNCVRDPDLRITDSECQVYTLGTGSWRSVAPGVSFEYNCRSIDTFHNGDLHWLVADLKGCSLISSFDLETELFRTFSPPPPRLPESRRFLSVLVVLEDCLCLCDNTSDVEIVVWMMKEDGWRKEFVISKLVDLAGPSYEVVYPLKVFRDGDVLMRWDDSYLFYCSGENRTATEIATIELHGPGRIEAMLHTSSFVSLKCFGVENDVMGNKKDFGGKVIVFGGDFRQVLPVVPKATIHQTISASLVKSYLWSRMKRISLSRNMRARDDPNFSEFLLRVGNGEQPTDNEGNIEIPKEMIIEYRSLLTCLWEDLATNEGEKLYHIAHQMPIVAISNVTSQLQMQTTTTTIIQINPDIQEIGVLKNWLSKNDDPIKISGLQMKRRIQSSKEVTLKAIIHNRNDLFEVP